MRLLPRQQEARRTNDGRRARAFTLVELLVVVSIIGVLFALLLPAVQAARETARRSQCASRLKQMALAALNHEAAHGHLPTGGWGYRWVGDSGSGYDHSQPGGWAYNLLAFAELQNLRDLGGNQVDRLKSKQAIPDALHDEMLLLVTTPVPLFSCPSKRPAAGRPLVDGTGSFPVLAWNARKCEVGSCAVVRGDYRCNAGNKSSTQEVGPSPAEVDAWLDSPAPSNLFNGVIYQRSTVRLATVTDGLSKTILLGEKSLHPDDYETGQNSADDQSLYTGHDQDNAAVTGSNSEPLPPLPDHEAVKSLSWHRFGSAHPSVCLVAFCDGAVVGVGFDTDAGVFSLLGGRSDQEVISAR